MILFVYLFFSEEKKSERIETSKVDKIKNSKSFSIKKEEYSQKKVESLKLSHSQQESEEISFELEYTQKLESLKVLESQMPFSEKKLMALVVESDSFAGKEIKPHTIKEIQHRRLGAIKVMALKALMKSKDEQQLEKRLNQVIAGAQDPTIIKIAKAAKKSLNQGRSFFEDFPQAIGNL